MRPTTDLVRDSKLRTAYRNGITRHTIEKSDHRGRRRVRIDQRWKRDGENLGAGTFGVVWRETLVGGESDVPERAVKMIQKRIGNSHAVDYSRELEAIAKFSRGEYKPFFVESYGWFESRDHVFITMEYFEHGDLQAYLDSVGSMSEQDARQVSYQILEGICKMHDNGFAHRDLKPSNILIRRTKDHEEGWWVKIGDFGVSKRAEGMTALRTVSGTAGFQAPEVLVRKGFLFLEETITSKLLRNEHEYTFVVDIWALGEITYRAICGTSPFTTGLAAYVNGKNDFPTDLLSKLKTSGEGIGLISQLMQVFPKKRPTATAALKHPWFKQFQDISSRSSGEFESVDENMEIPSGFLSPKFNSTISSSPGMGPSEFAAWTDLDGTNISGPDTKHRTSPPENSTIPTDPADEDSTLSSLDQLPSEKEEARSEKEETNPEAENTTIAWSSRHKEKLSRLDYALLGIEKALIEQERIQQTQALEKAAATTKEKEMVLPLNRVLTKSEFWPDDSPSNISQIRHRRRPVRKRREPVPVPLAEEEESSSDGSHSGKLLVSYGNGPVVRRSPRQEPHDNRSETSGSKPTDQVLTHDPEKPGQAKKEREKVVRNPNSSSWGRWGTLASAGSPAPEPKRNKTKVSRDREPPRTPATEARRSKDKDRDRDREPPRTLALGTRRSRSKDYYDREPLRTPVPVTRRNRSIERDRESTRTRGRIVKSESSEDHHPSSKEVSEAVRRPHVYLERQKELARLYIDSSRQQVPRSRSPNPPGLLTFKEKDRPKTKEEKPSRGTRFLQATGLMLRTTTKKKTKPSEPTSPTSPTKGTAQPEENEENRKLQSSRGITDHAGLLNRRSSKKVVPGLPRPLTFKRMNSKERDSSIEVPAHTPERKETPAGISRGYSGYPLIGKTPEIFGPNDPVHSYGDDFGLEWSGELAPSDSVSVSSSYKRKKKSYEDYQAGLSTKSPSIISGSSGGAEPRPYGRGDYGDVRSRSKSPSGMSWGSSGFSKSRITSAILRSRSPSPQEEQPAIQRQTWSEINDEIATQTKFRLGYPQTSSATSELGLEEEPADNPPLFTERTSSPYTYPNGRRRSRDTQPIRSGVSGTSSINNPKLLATVEDAIKRLILPELNSLKEEQPNPDTHIH